MYRFSVIEEEVIQMPIYKLFFYSQTKLSGSLRYYKCIYFLNFYFAVAKVGNFNGVFRIVERLNYLGNVHKDVRFFALFRDTHMSYALYTIYLCTMSDFH